MLFDEDLIKFTSPKLRSGFLNRIEPVLDMESNEISNTHFNNFNISSTKPYHLHSPLQASIEQNQIFSNESLETSRNTYSFNNLLDATVTNGNSNFNENTINESAEQTQIKSFNESLKAVDVSNLDIVDFIEVNNDLINSEQEFLWYVYSFYYDLFR